MVDGADSIEIIPGPADLGFPEKFVEWRGNQTRAIQQGLGSNYRFMVQVLPTGDGKSASNMAQAVLNGGRTIYLTSTKGLQDQLLGDFVPIGLVDIRGKASYQCESDPELTCEEGSSGNCIYKGSTRCPHARAMFKAQSSRLVTTNYACWIALNKYGKGLGDFDMMICDEAHNTVGELEKGMQILLSNNEIETLLGYSWPRNPYRAGMDEWKSWAKQLADRASELADTMQAEIDRTKAPRVTDLRNLSHLKNLCHKLSDLSTCNPRHWVADEWEYGFQFDPINPARYAERILFRGIPKVLLTSATATKRTIQMLGIPEDDLDFQEFPSEFLPTRTPIIVIPTVKMSFRIDEEGIRRWIRRIDEIVGARLDRKGIIHVPSFQLRDEIIKRSEFAAIMVSNYTELGDLTSDVIQDFKSERPPSVLVSPSISTGYDFPGETCRYQIIAKVPFPDRRSKVMQAREKEDKGVSISHAVKQLVQQAGRGMRSKDDWQEVFIIDDNFNWVYWSHRDEFPKWFQALRRNSLSVPFPPRLGR